MPQRLFPTLAVWRVAARNIPVTGLAVDSRAVRPGYLFAALPGLQVHGADYISAALALGATSILTDAAGVRRARVHA